MDKLTKCEQICYDIKIVTSKTKERVRKNSKASDLKKKEVKKWQKEKSLTHFILHAQKRIGLT